MDAAAWAFLGILVTQAVALIGLLLERGAKGRRTEKRVGTSESALDTMIVIAADQRAEIVDLKRQLADRPPRPSGSETP